jgi:hypothetical protein
VEKEEVDGGGIIDWKAEQQQQPGSSLPGTLPKYQADQPTDLLILITFSSIWRWPLTVPACLPASQRPTTGLTE